MSKHAHYQDPWNQTHESPRMHVFFLANRPPFEGVGPLTSFVWGLRAREVPQERKRRGRWKEIRSFSESRVHIQPGVWGDTSRAKFEQRGFVHVRQGLSSYVETLLVSASLAPVSMVLEILERLEAVHLETQAHFVWPFSLQGVGSQRLHEPQL